MSTLSGKRTGTAANTQLQVVLDIPLEAKQLALIATLSGGDGNFGSQNMTVEASADDGTSYTTLDTVGLGTTTFKFVNYYNGSAVNPAVFGKVRITIPQLGSGKTAILNYAAK
jgi:spore maturation protein SpmB